MGNAFGGLINRLEMTKERLSKFEDISTETSKTKMQREKEKKKTNKSIKTNP